MKPKHIFFVRHGQSEGNIDKSIYNRIPDHKISLTPLGYRQAFERGAIIQQLTGVDRIQLYSSPFQRARQTSEEIKKHFSQVLYREDPRLREQEWATCMRLDSKALEEEARDAYGKFFYRFKSGESCADVYDRVSLSIDTFHRDFEKTDFPTVMVVSGHGMSNRVLVMRWFHLPIEIFDRMKNPENGSAYHLILNQMTLKYELSEPFELWPE